MAAGIGSRYGGLKQIEAIGPSGEAIIEYSIYDALRAGFGRIVFVIRKDIEKACREMFEPKLSGRVDMDFVFQELDMVPAGFKCPDGRVKPWGTAHAVWVARNHIREPFVVINADDFYGAGSYGTMARYFKDGDPQSKMYGMIGYQVRHTLSEFGSVSRGICEVNGDGFLKAIVERTEIVKKKKDFYFSDETGRHVKLQGDEPVSMNFWGFTPSIFEQIETAFTEFIGGISDKIKSEILLPSVVNDLIPGNMAKVKVLPAIDQWFGVTYKEDKQLAVEHIRNLVTRGLYPKRLWA